MNLPDQPINVVVRADGSWHDVRIHQAPECDKSGIRPGVRRQHTSQLARRNRSKGNEGVTASVMTTPGAIGYIEYGYAKSQNLPMATLENKSGRTTSRPASPPQSAPWHGPIPRLIAWVPDPQPGCISDRHIHLDHLLQDVSATRPNQAIKGLLNYCLTDGQKESESWVTFLCPRQCAKDKAPSKAP